MRGIISYYSLFHADRHTGLEPEFQKKLADLDTFQQLPHQRLIKLRDSARLRIDEVQQFLNTLPVRCFGSIVHYRLFLHLTQVQDFFRQVIIVHTASQRNALGKIHFLLPLSQELLQSFQYAGLQNNYRL